MTTLPLRAVIITRPTDFDELIARHGTRGQAEFFLESRDQSLAEIEDRHRAQADAVAQVKQLVPDDWRSVEISRAHLDRFLFADGDIAIAIGQDGLVANLAKYANGRPAIGVNPSFDTIAGVLARHRPGDIGKLLARTAAGECQFEHRSMIEATVGQSHRLLALNEIFVGHRSHQSARYLLSAMDKTERQSSSGVIVASGTGTTGWARSIIDATHSSIALAPDARRLAFFAREPWPSPTTGNSLRSGYVLDDEAVTIRSEMNEGGVIFADGIEADRIRFDWGLEVTIRLARERLNLVIED